MTAAALRDEDLLSVRTGDRRRLREALEPGVRGDVGGDVDRVLSGDEVRGHVRLEEIRIVLTHRILPGELDLVVDDVQDRRLLVAFGAGLGECGVEIGPDRRRRSGTHPRTLA